LKLINEDSRIILIKVRKLVHVSCAVIINEGKILIAQRPNGKEMSGKWEFPGGKIEKDESAEHCLIREISEELNIKISISHALEAVKFEYESFKIILYPFIAVIENGIIAAKEHESIIFCKPNELSAYDFLAADLLIFPQIDSHFKRKAEI
jgi:8-oxo-dGTP diphosphatase